MAGLQQQDSHAGKEVATGKPIRQRKGRARRGPIRQRMLLRSDGTGPRQSVYVVITYSWMIFNSVSVIPCVLFF